MSITPNRDAAEKGVAQVRALYEARGSTEIEQQIRERMSLDATAALMLNMADLLDRNVTPSRAGGLAMEASASALASALITLTQGDKAGALATLLAAMPKFVDIAGKFIAEGVMEGVQTEVPPAGGGRA